MSDDFSFQLVQDKMLELINDTTPTPNSIKAVLNKLSEQNIQMRDAWITLKRSVYLNPNDNNIKKRFELLMDTYMPEFERLSKKVAEKLRGVVVTESDLKTCLDRIANEFRSQALGTEDTEVEIRKLARKYEQLNASFIVKFDGHNITPQVALAQLRTEPDRDRRRELWIAQQEAVLNHSSEIDAIFTELVAMRKRLANQAGFGNFLSYYWSVSQREYTADDALVFLDTLAVSIEKSLKDLNLKKSRNIGTDFLEPWDVDYITSEFSGSNYANMLDIVERAFRQIDPEFGNIITEARRSGDIDTESRPNKPNYSAASYFTRSGKPMIYGNISDHPSDIRILLHECGHCVHYNYSVPGRLFWLKGAPAEVSESVAIFFELLGGTLLQDAGYFEQDDNNTYKRSIFESILNGLVRVTQYERFQHQLYSDTPKTNFDEIFASLMLNFVNWNNSPIKVGQTWRMRPHLFGYPLRDMSYATATLNALHLLRQYKQDPAQFLEKLKVMMAFGKASSARASLAVFDITFPMGEDNITEALNTLEEYFNL